MKKIVIASTNPGKLKEFKEILAPAGFNVLSMSSLNFNNEIEETALTFKENALIKAKAVFETLKMPTIADDSGLEIKALNGRPGVFSARYASTNNKHCSNELNISKILKEMENETDRTARMVCSLCFINRFGKVFHITATCDGEIAKEPEQINGFGFDYIFLYNGKMISSLSIQEKNKISHRGKALNQLLNNLKTWWDEKS